MAESGDSSPLSAAATDDAHHDSTNNAPSDSAAAPPPPPSSSLVPPPIPPPAKVRLMVSYGGRIQPRPHDNQLSYVNGETKILSLDRPLRFADFAARLAALAGSANLCVVKYQLPGEDLDALVSVTCEDDLEHLVVEYDRLHLLRAPAAAGSGSGGGSSRGGGGGSSTPRLRVFLFPVVFQPPHPLLPEPKQENREWYLDLRSVSPTPQQYQYQQSQPQPQAKQDAAPVNSPPPPPPAVQMAQAVMVAPRTNPDYLFGLEDGSYVLPPAVKIKDPAGDLPTMRENVPVEIPLRNEDRVPIPPAADNAMVAPGVSPTELHRQIHEKLQLADNATQQAPPPAPAPAPLAVQQAPPPPPAPVVVAQQSPPTPTAPAAPVAQVAPVPATLSRNGSDDSLTRAYPPATATAPPEYYVPKVQEKPQVIPPSSTPPAAAFLPVPGRYASVAPGNGADHGPFFFIPAPPHGYYASANPNGTSYYAVAPHNGHNGNGNGNGTTPAPSMTNAQAYPQVAYDSNGRAVYYTGLLPQYPSAVNGMSAAAAVLGNEPSKPVAVKPTVS